MSYPGPIPDGDALTYRDAVPVLTSWMSRRRDVVLALAFCGFGLAELLSGARYEGFPVWPRPTWLSAVAVVLVGSSLAWRRSRPTASVLVVLVTISSCSLALGPVQSTAGFLALLVAVFSGAAHAARPRLVAGLAAAALVAHNVRDPTVRGPADWFWSAGFIAVGLLLGVAVRTRQLRIGQLEDSAQRVAAEHERRVAEATAAERAAIARELHDIVAHHVSVIVIQAQAGAGTSDDDGRTARRLFETIETTGRSALDDLRRLLRLLDGDPSSTVPAPGLPGLVDLAQLVERMAATGVDVRVDTPAEWPALSDAAGLAAYRTVQEAVTNAARHAPGAAVDIRISLTQGPGAEEMVLIEVQDDGVPSGEAPHLPGTGRGLIGMRERLDLAGGALLSAGPAGRGHLVRAWVPVLTPVGSDVGAGHR